MRKSKIYYFPDNIIKDCLSKPKTIKEVERHDFMTNINNYTDSLFLMRGITNYKYCHHIRNVGSNFFYFDTGYFGNMNSYYNSETYKKAFHRMVFNNLQMDKITNYDNSRYKIILKYIKNEYGVKESEIIKPWKKDGSKIMICPPSAKVAAVFGLDAKVWTDKTIKEIKKYSDREIVIRLKDMVRMDRVRNPIQAELDKGIFILVTYNSIAATEAIIHGIPALTLGLNAATSVSLNKIKNIENPIYPDRQLWLNNLSFGQFHIEEFQNGTVWAHIKDILKS